jgi:FkbM family methyltransferase
MPISKLLLKIKQKFQKNADCREILKFSGASTSQNMQDVFVLSTLGFKKEGYFVEFGAADGVKFSNTYLLEKKFGWSGIVAEPAKSWHPALKKNRGCTIDYRCVWAVSGERMNFIDSSQPLLSTLEAFEHSDGRERRSGGDVYTVDSVSLTDLLREHNAPQTIDYLSIDTEGSEFDILQNFDFGNYAIRVITVEHNYTSNRQKIFGLLSKLGYQRRFEGISGADDWYVLPSAL